MATCAAKAATVSDCESSMDMRPEANEARTSPPRDDVAATARLHCSISGRYLLLAYGLITERQRFRLYGLQSIRQLLKALRRSHASRRWSIGPAQQPRQSLGRGCRKSFFCAVQQFSKVKYVSRDAGRTIHNVLHSGAEGNGLYVLQGLGFAVQGVGCRV